MTKETTTIGMLIERQNIVTTEMKDIQAKHGENQKIEVTYQNLPMGKYVVAIDILEDEPEAADKPTMDHYQNLIKGTTCKWCQRGDGRNRDISLEHQTIQHYDHDGGWPLEGYKGLRWLYVECPHCDYQWSLSKLGVPRYSPETTNQ